MPRTLRLRSVSLFVVLCLLVLPGCGKSGATLKGTLVLPSNLKLTDTDSVRVSFMPEDQKGQGYPATVSVADKSFVAQGPGKKGIPAGKYKVAVQLQPYMGSPDSEQRSAAFEQFNNAFNATNSRLTYEVTSESTQSITVDVPKGSVTKN